MVDTNNALRKIKREIDDLSNERMAAKYCWRTLGSPLPKTIPVGEDSNYWDYVRACKTAYTTRESLDSYISSLEKTAARLEKREALLLKELQQIRDTEDQFNSIQCKKGFSVALFCSKMVSGAVEVIL